MKNISPLKVLIGLFILALFFLGYSAGQPLYRDRNGFSTCYTSIDYESAATASQADRIYQECRSTYLTSKLFIQSYSLTILIWLSLAIVILMNGGKNLLVKTPKWKLGLTGLLTVGITIFSRYATLVYDFRNGRFPHWEDSLTSLLARIPLIGAGIFIFVLLQMLFAIGASQPGGALLTLNLKKDSKILLLLLGLSGGATLLFTARGDFFYLLAAFFWIFFYLELLVARRTPANN